MFRILDTNETPNLIVTKNASKAKAKADAANKYRGIATKLTIQRLAKDGKYETVGTLQTK